MAKYTLNNVQRNYWPRKLLIIIAVAVVVLIVGMISVRQFYNANLAPVSESSDEVEFIIEQGQLAPDIAAELAELNLIRSEQVFLWYVKSRSASDDILAGTYRLQPNYSTPEIVSIITQGKVATDLVTIYPAQRLDQVKTTLIRSGFKKTDVDRALNPKLYRGHPALVDKPAKASLEGYLYPESFQRDASTTPEDVVRASLDQMNTFLTPQIRAAFSRKGLSVYQGIALASIVENEVPNQKSVRVSEREQVAQVFLTRLKNNIAVLDGKSNLSYSQAINYSSSYNTYENPGLPPTPISNVSESSLKAVAFPAKTTWRYFVAGDNGKTYFSKTLEEHEALTAKYCKKLCN
jgi:UPF0755 protein